MGTVELTNEIKDPRCATGLDWQATSSTGVATLTPGLPDLGGSGRVERTAGAGFGSLSAFIQPTQFAPVRARQVVHTRARVQADQSGMAIGMKLHWASIFATPIGATTTLCEVVSEVGEPALLEGFDTAPDGAALVWLETYGLSFGAAAVLIGEVCLVVDPWGDVPGAVIGGEPGCQWDGPPNESTSSGVLEVETPAIFGYNDNPFQHPDPHELSFEEELTLARASGANTIRFALTFDLRGETPQPSAGTAIDWHRTIWGAYLDAIRAADLKAFVIAWQALPWMAGGEVALKELEPARFADFAALYVELLREYRDVIVAIEFGNEPNLSFFWNWATATPEDPDPAAYTAILEELYGAVKAATPEISVVAGALSASQSSTGHNATLQSFLDGMIGAGAEAWMDAVSIHPYPAALAGEPYLPGPRSGPSADPVWGLGIWGAVGETRARTSVPVWCTETGQIARNLQEERWQAQSNVLARGMLSRAVDVDAVFIHELTRETAADTAWPVTNLPARTYRGAAEVLA